MLFWQIFLENDGVEALTFVLQDLHSTTEVLQEVTDTLSLVSAEGSAHVQCKSHRNRRSILMGGSLSLQLMAIDNKCHNNAHLICDRMLILLVLCLSTGLTLIVHLNYRIKIIYIWWTESSRSYVNNKGQICVCYRSLTVHC